MQQVILKTDIIRQMVRAEMTEYNAKIQELEDRLSAAEAELRALKAEKSEDDPPKPPHQRPYLENNQTYFYVDVKSEVSDAQWLSDLFDLGAYKIGNVFPTAEAAEFAAERLKVLAEMREWAGIWDDPWVMIYDGWSPKAISIHAPDVTFGELRFATREDAEGCIKAVGKDRLKKYYFGIPEDSGCCTSER